MIKASFLNIKVMFKINVLIFLFLFINKLQSQNYLSYYETINRAEISYLDGNYKKSDSLYKLAFNLVKKPFKEDFLYAAINSDKLKDNSKTFQYLTNGIERGLSEKRLKENRKKLKYFFKSDECRILKKKYNGLREEYLSNIDIKLRNELLNMAHLDQKARKPIFGTSDKMKKVDSENFNRLMNIIKNNNNKWPGFSLIGEISPKGKYDFDLIGTIAIMPLHFKKDEVKQIEPFMREAVLSGNMYPYQYARIIDYKLENTIIEVNSNNRVKKFKSCTLYGSFTKELICDCDKAEIERQKIGLEPLKDFYRKKGESYECKK